MTCRPYGFRPCAGRSTASVPATSRARAPHSPPRPRVALRQISPQPSGFAGTCVQWTRRTGAPVVPSQASAKNGANLKKGAP